MYIIFPSGTILIPYFATFLLLFLLSYFIPLSSWLLTFWTSYFLILLSSVFYFLCVFFYCLLLTVQVKSSEKSSYAKLCHIGNNLVWRLGQQFVCTDTPDRSGRGEPRKNSLVVWPRIIKKMWNINNIPTRRINSNDQDKPIITERPRKNGVLLLIPVAHPISMNIEQPST